MIDVITKCDSSVYYKVRQLFYYKVWLRLLQSATIITRCDSTAFPSGLFRGKPRPSTTHQILCNPVPRTYSWQLPFPPTPHVPFQSGSREIGNWLMQWNSYALAAALRLKSCQVWTKMWNCPTWKGQAINVPNVPVSKCGKSDIPRPLEHYSCSSKYMVGIMPHIPIIMIVQMIFWVSFQCSYIFFWSFNTVSLSVLYVANSASTRWTLQHYGTFQLEFYIMLDSWLLSIGIIIKLKSPY